MITIDPPAPTIAKKRHRSMWPSPVWPTRVYSGVGHRVLLGAILAGVFGSIVLGLPGIGYALTAAALLAVLAVVLRGRTTLWQAVGGIAVLALASVSVFRAADWLVALALWLAVLVAGAVLVESRTWTGLLLGALVPILVPARAIRWTSRGARTVRTGGLRAGRVAMVALATVVLVGVFAALFAGADPAFARLIDSVSPRWRTDVMLQRLFVFVSVTGATLAFSYVARNTPRFDLLARAPRSTISLWEWSIPLAGMVAVFGAFVAVQLTSLFGGQHHVMVTDGLTNAEYARQGFWQLLAVTALTLLVLAVTIRKAPRETVRDRTVLRVLLGAVCGLSLVVVASALHRMSLYEQQYGHTTLRLFVTAVELLLGCVFLLVIAAGITMTGRFLPRAVGIGIVLTVLGLAVLNPDAYIARQNVDRFEDTGKIDTYYLSTLSADARGELNRLPEPYRSCVLGARPIGDRQWFEYNVSEDRAADIVVRDRSTVCNLDGVSVR